MMHGILSVLLIWMRQGILILGLVWGSKVCSVQPIGAGDDSEFRHCLLLQHKRLTEQGDLPEEQSAHAHGASNPRGAFDDKDHDSELSHFTVVHTTKFIEHCSTLPEDITHYDRYRTQAIHGFVEYIGHCVESSELLPEIHNGWKKSTLILTGHHPVGQEEEEKEGPDFFENRRSLLDQRSKQDGGSGQPYAFEKVHHETDTTISGMLQQVKRALDQADEEVIDAREKTNKTLHYIEAHHAHYHTKKKRLSEWEKTRSDFGDIEQLTRYHQTHDQLAHSLKMTEESLAGEQETLKKMEKECKRAEKALDFWKKIQNNIMGNLDQGVLHSADTVKRCLALMGASVQNHPSMETVWHEILTKHRQAEAPWNQVCNALKEMQDHGYIPQHDLGAKDDLDWDTYTKKQEMLDLGEKVSQSLVQCQQTYRDFYCQLVNALMVLQNRTKSLGIDDDGVTDKAIATIRQLNTAVAWFLNDISKNTPSPVVF